MTQRAEIIAIEERLRSAMLARDIAALDALLCDDALFVDQNGAQISKAADLAMHRSGRLEIASLDYAPDMLVRCYGEAAATCVTAEIRGTFDGAAFSGRFVYSRVWTRGPNGWRVAQAHCSAVLATG
ncbi:nuclear transport factor 2 family protein [Sphingopyxis sp.]|uniref:nuclear transport factor 2 family protein n=1 Tax=Sphingopyxis sp. TaxID=1908224 RepID=UPI002EDB8706